MNAKTQEAIEGMVGVIAASALAAGLVALAEAALDSLIVPTNMSSSGLAGERGLHPTVTEINLDESKVAVSAKEGKLSHDQVNAQKGEVKASTLDATAQDGEATALESGASAVRTKAGASDIELKALKMT